MVSPVVKYRCEVDHKEGWAPKNWWFPTVVLEKTLESPLDCKEINPKGNQPGIFIGRTDAEGAPIFWPPDVNSWLTGKDPNAGKDRGQKEKRAAEDEMVREHYQLGGRVWANSRRQWKTGKPGVLQSTGLQRVKHDLSTEQKEAQLTNL